MPVYAVDKPLGLSSHDVVARARKIFRTRRVGHAGTLDPLAGGLLTLLVEDDTKLSPFLTGSDKRYLAWVSFGASSVTLDSEGPVVASGDPGGLRAAEVEAQLPAFMLMTEQSPPAFSAVKRGGVKAYEEARAGRDPDLPPRPVAYHSLRLLAFAARREELPKSFGPGSDGWEPVAGGRSVPLPEHPGEFPTALLSLSVAAGTYVRSFARDLGEAVGVPAFLSGLLRTGAGGLDLSQAVRLDELDAAAPLSALDVLGLPRRVLDAQEVRRIRQGQRLPMAVSERTALVDDDGVLVAVVESAGGRMRLLRVWPERVDS